MPPRALWLTIYLSCIALVSQVYCSDDKVRDNRRPIWNIGHMVNSIDQVDEFLDLGANAIESDVSFNENGSAEYVYHGTPCDCGRWCNYYENIDKFIKYIRQVTTPGKANYKESFILMMWDLKISSLRASARRIAGEDFARRLKEHYWRKVNSKARVYMILGVPSIDYANFIDGFRKKLISLGYGHFLGKIGYDFSGNERFYRIQMAFRELGFREHVWLSNGITNCAWRSEKHQKRLEAAIKEREFDSVPLMDKVYSWTYDYISSMKRELLLGVDGLITNHPNVFLDAIRAPGYRDIVRLATYDDNPFERIRFPRHSNLDYEAQSWWWSRKNRCNWLFEYRLSYQHYAKQYKEEKCAAMYV